MSSYRSIRFPSYLSCFLLLLSSAVQATATVGERDRMMQRMTLDDGCLAALDQSGGSTPKALEAYGYPSELYKVGEASMYDAVHAMRTRLVISPSFSGDQVLGAILFEDTMKRTIDGEVPFAEYLWKEKQVVPFLKVDKGLCEEADGVQLMKPMPDLDRVLQQAADCGIFGTKMRSIIKENNPKGIHDIVSQQFAIGRQILDAGLTPIIEPEVDITSSTKDQCEDILKKELLLHLNQLGEDDKVLLKLSLPTRPDFYKECANHPNCLRMVALSGGYSRGEATALLREQSQMSASFSRALTEGLYHNMSKDAFDTQLQQSLQQIFDASRT